MKNILENYFKLYGLAGALLIAAVVINLVVWGWANQARSEYIQKNKELLALTAKKSSPAQIKRGNESVASLTDRVTHNFVAPEGVVDLIVFLEDSAKETGNLVSINSTDEAGAGSTEKKLFKFKIALTGGYPDFINFLARLENAPYLIRTRRVEVFKTTDSLSRQSVVRENLDIEIPAL